MNAPLGMVQRVCADEVAQGYWLTHDQGDDGVIEVVAVDRTDSRVVLTFADGEVRTYAPDHRLTRWVGVG